MSVGTQEFQKHVQEAMGKLTEDDVDDIKMLLELSNKELDVIRTADDLFKAMNNLKLVSIEKERTLKQLLGDHKDILAELDNKGIFKPAEPDLVMKTRWFILNNHEYGKTGASNFLRFKKDEGLLKNTIDSLDMNVNVQRNKTAADMSKLFKKWSEREFDDFNCVVVVILSQVTDNWELMGVDNKVTELNEMVQMIGAKTKDKKTIFLLETCQGATQPIESHSRDSNWRSADGSVGKQFENTFIHYNKSKDFQSFNNGDGESLFLAELCKELMKEKQPSWELITEVNKNVKYDKGKEVEAPKPVASLCSTCTFRNFASD